MSWTPIKLRRRGEIAFIGESESPGGGSQPGTVLAIGPYTVNWDDPATVPDKTVADGFPVSISLAEFPEGIPAGTRIFGVYTIVTDPWVVGDGGQLVATVGVCATGTDPNVTFDTIVAAEQIPLTQDNDTANVVVGEGMIIDVNTPLLGASISARSKVACDLVFNFTGAGPNPTTAGTIEVSALVAIPS